MRDGGAFAFGGSGTSLQRIAAQGGAIDVLKDAAELLSARTLVDARDRPLRLEELVARWQRTADFRKDDSAPSPAWLRRQAARLLSRNNAAAAIEQLESLRKIDTWSWTDRMLYLAALARTDRWTEVVDEIDRLGATRDAAPELVFIETIARRRAGDVEGARTLCGTLLQRHAATRNPDRALWILRACLLDPAAATGSAWRAASVLQQQVHDLRLHGTTASIAGAVAVRDGRLDEGITLLERAAADGERTPHTALFLAMALARSDRVSDAQKWIAEAGKFVFPPGMFSQEAFRTSWLQAEAAILREEIAPLLAPRPGPAARR